MFYSIYAEKHTLMICYPFVNEINKR